jgi:hypothetical protein
MTIFFVQTFYWNCVIIMAMLVVPFVQLVSWLANCGAALWISFYSVMFDSLCQFVFSATEA